ncbi:hypothetical protein M1146_05925 [Patescibacteria group bacterium]|nr:hypothetical protein [Patescibacteria group bacterium]
MPKEGFNRKPTSEEQLSCKKALSRQDVDAIGDCSCSPLEYIDGEIEAVLHATTDKFYLQLGLAQALKMIASCQSSCGAIKYAKILPIDLASHLACNHMSDAINQIIDGKITRDEILKQELE